MTDAFHHFGLGFVSRRANRARFWLWKGVGSRRMRAELAMLMEGEGRGGQLLQMSN